MRLGIVWPEPDGPVVSGDRLIRPSRFVQDHAEIAVGHEIIGLELECLLEGGDRLLSPALVPQDIAEVDVKLGHAGFELDGTVEGSGRFVESPRFRNVLA